MSKRSEEAALKAYPENIKHKNTPLEYDGNTWRRAYYDDGYEQAEQDTIERVCKWLEENATYTHPRKGTKTCIINLNALREAMEEEL